MGFINFRLSRPLNFYAQTHASGLHVHATMATEIETQTTWPSLPLLLVQLSFKKYLQQIFRSVFPDCMPEALSFKGYRSKEFYLEARG